MNLILGKYSMQSFSQEGEDFILFRIFERKSKGFYVDIGAHHPFRFSNTYLFYKRGWTGINIDANFDNMVLFYSLRPRDINLNIAVGQRGKLIYYMFNESALNTFSKELADLRNGKWGYKITKEYEIDVMPLNEVLDKYLPSNQQIDFMSIDCEGLDFEVLQTNDWKKYRPIVLLVEILPSENIGEILKQPTYLYLKEKGYNLYAKCFNTCIFIENTHLDAVKEGLTG